MPGVGRKYIDVSAGAGIILIICIRACLSLSIHYVRAFAGNGILRETTKAPPI